MTTEATTPLVVLPAKESLRVEFKSDKKRLSDKELVEVLACLANAEGGELWLGVEDDGMPTGRHLGHVDFTGLPALEPLRALMGICGLGWDWAPAVSSNWEPAFAS